MILNSSWFVIQELIIYIIILEIDCTIFTTVTVWFSGTRQINFKLLIFYPNFNLIAVFIEITMTQSNVWTDIVPQEDYSELNLGKRHSSDVRAVIFLDAVFKWTPASGSL